MLNGISFKSKASLAIATFIMLLFFITEVFVVLEVIAPSYEIAAFGLFCVMSFVPPFLIIMAEFVEKRKREYINKVALEAMLDKSCLVSKTDRYGKITEVNEKFCEVSGYMPQELLGRDHSVLNSGTHSKDFWKDMYRTTVKYKSIWFDTVTNRAKDGRLYVVKSWIMANFDTEGKLVGFTSIRHDVTSLYDTLADVGKKNTYLEHAAKILRHDMHSGINTYLPRGISSLKRRLDEETIKEKRLQMPMRLIEDGLVHTQKVYKGVFEFTNLVREDATLTKEYHNIRDILDAYFQTTSYADQVILCPDLPTLLVNEALFCTAVDNMVRNGLKYNDSKTKFVKIQMVDDGTVGIIDNGRGMSQEEYEILSKPYLRRKDQKEEGTGLGLNITLAICKEHGFELSAEEREEGGTIMRIKVK
jgi:PAS domain S-box-containing protein